MEDKITSKEYQMNIILGEVDIQYIDFKMIITREMRLWQFSSHLKKMQFLD